MKCDKHRKEYVGGCMWCGRRVCEVCIAKREGSKIYCDKCVVLLGNIRRESLPSFGSLPSSGRRFVLRNGFLQRESV